MRRMVLAVFAVALVASGCAKEQAAVSTSPPEETSAMSGVPTLTITSPKDGDTITGPMKVTYEVTGFDIGAAPKGHFHAIWGTGPNDYAAFTDASGNSGTVTASKNPSSDVHEVTFQLAKANHELLSNPEAKVVVKDLTFKEGSAASPAGIPGY